MSSTDRTKVTITVRVSPRDAANDVTLPDWSTAAGTPGALHERFSLGDQLGKGGMGEVYVAQDGLLNREVAVKVLSDAALDRPTLARFLREAQVTAQLTHPNVVPIFSLLAGRGGAPALAMKLIEGVTFTEYIAECTRVLGTTDFDAARHPIPARISHFLKVCDAVHYAHDRGVLHRDLKPANLMLGPFGEVYVMDWGIARVLDDDEVVATAAATGDWTGDDEVTQAGDIVGTTGYMAPEQARGKLDRVGPASDQYALGMVLFELVTGFRARPTPEGIDNHLSVAMRGDRHTWAEAKATGLPPGLRAIVDKATAVSRKDRYAHVGELAQDLRRYLRGDEVAAWPDSLPRKVWRRLARYPMALMSGLLAVVVVAAGVTVGAQWRLLEEERVQAERQEHLAALVAHVSRHVQQFDRELFHIEILLEGLAVATRDVLAHGDSPRGAPLGTGALAAGTAPADTGRLERYDQEVTFERPIQLRARGVDAATVADFQERLFGLEPVFREMALRSADEYAVSLPLTEGLARMRAGVPLQWAYIGFANGVLLNYPGNFRYPADYDPRERPWYVDHVDLRGPSYGTLYADATGSGFLLPCNRAIHGPNDELIGVAGMDLSMDHVIEDMDVPEVTGLRETFLVGPDGEVLVRSSERGTRTDVEVAGKKETERFGVAALEAHARDGTASGFVREGDDLYVFARLETVPWLLVIQLRADEQGL